MAFCSTGEGTLENIFVSEFELIDRFVGGELWSWGVGTCGVLGDNSIIQKSSPVQTISGGTNWKQVSTGCLQTAAIKTDGTLWMWGCNLFGNLGDNSKIAQSSPIQTVSGGNNWKQVDLGNSHTAAIKTDGTLWIWGAANQGRHGTNNIINQSSPVQTVSGGTNWKQVSLGAVHTAAIKTDGTLWNWGFGGFGVLGDNSTINRSSPVQTVSGGTNWCQVSTGQCHTAAIKTDGTLWVWGLGASGQLGTGNRLNRSSPIQTFTGGNNWKQVSACFGHTGAIKTDGTLWMWGCGTNGRLGDNSQISRSAPVQTITGGTNWKQISAGACHTGAIKTDGTLWMWGAGFNGRLGNNANANQSSPVQTIAGGNNWKQVSLSCYSSALKIGS